MKLLIVDDEMVIRQGLVLLSWAKAGITQVQTADNGVEALRLISEYCPDVILTDIKMPGLDGLRLAEELAEGSGQYKLILLTGYGTFEYAQKAITHGVFEYLLKPSSPDEILSTVRRAVKRLEEEEVLRRKKRMEAQKEEMYSSMEDSSNRVILDYIENNYMNEITLTTLAEYTHFSTTYLSRLIKKETNYNFTKILVTVRMLKAAELLRNTDLKIYTICDKVGIHDQRYFSQQFRKTFGKTPMEYRKTGNGKSEGSVLEFIRKSRQEEI